MPSYSLRELAEIVEGEILGEPDVLIRGVAGIREAEQGQITFLANPKYESYLTTTRASAVIANRDGKLGIPIIKVSNPYFAFLKVLTLFSESAHERYPRVVHPTAIIEESASIGTDVAIGAYAVIEAGVAIGDRSTIMPHVCVCREAKIGE